MWLLRYWCSNSYRTYHGKNNILFILNMLKQKRWTLLRRYEWQSFTCASLLSFYACLTHKNKTEKEEAKSAMLLVTELGKWEKIHTTKLHIWFSCRDLKKSRKSWKHRDGNLTIGNERKSVVEKMMNVDNVRGKLKMCENIFLRNVT